MAVPEEAVAAGVPVADAVRVPVVVVVVAVVVLTVVVVLVVVVPVRAVIVAAPRTLAGMVAAVLFDFYGTLARAVEWGPTVEEVLTRRGVAVDPEARARWEAEAADGVDHRQHSTDRDRYVAWEQARLRRFAEACRVDAVDLDEVVGELYATMKEFTLEAYDEVPEVLAALRDRGLRVAVCSNWDWDLDQALRRTALDHLVDVVVTSAQAGARKPHPRIYRQTLDRCGVAAPDALFVGDTWGPDVEGPLAVGLRPVHVWRDGDERRAPPPPLVDGVKRVRNLGGVLDLV